jgi:hypothetical protein
MLEVAVYYLSSFITISPQQTKQNKNKTQNPKPKTKKKNKNKKYIINNK